MAGTQEKKEHTMNKLMKLLFTVALAVALCAIPQPAFAQGTALTATTISSAITSASATTVTLASATGVTIQGSNGQFNTVLYIGKELMGVKSLVSGTTYNVQRGLQATRPLTYTSGAGVLLGSPTGNFMSADYSAEVVPGTTCVNTNSVTLPHIYLKSGNFYDCVGATGTQQWMITNSDIKPVLGTTVASPAGVLTPTGTTFLVSGTNAITGITVPQGWASGMCLKILPTGAATTTTATNIAIASTMVVGKALFMCWNGTTSKWYPSY